MSVTQLSLELHFGATLHRRAVSEQKRSDCLSMNIKESHFGWGAVLENCSLFRGRASFSPNMIMKKNPLSSTKVSLFSKLLSKRAILLSFFSQCNPKKCVIKGENLYVTGPTKNLLILAAEWVLCVLGPPQHSKYVVFKATKSGPQQCYLHC